MISSENIVAGVHLHFLLICACNNVKQTNRKIIEQLTTILRWLEKSMKTLKGTY